MLFDPELIVAIQQFFGLRWSWLFHFFSFLGSTEGVAVIIALAIWLRGHKLGYRLLGIVVFATIVDTLLWSMISLPRPDAPGIVKLSQSPISSSFPSGHTVVGTAVWGQLALLDQVPKLLPLVLVPAIMLARLYLGVHYLGDVLGGLLIGLVILWLYQYLWPRLVTWAQSTSLRTFALLGVLAVIGTVVVAPQVLGTNRSWQMAGAVAGVVIGALLEAYYLDHTSTAVPLSKQVRKVVIGLAGLALIWWLGTQLANNILVLEAIAYGLMTLWIVFLAPWVFVRLDLAQSIEAKAPSEQPRGYATRDTRERESSIS